MKTGLDDYIVAHGTDALRQLMADAHRIQRPTPNDDDELPADPSGVGCWALGGGQPVPFPVHVLPKVLAAYVLAVAAALPCPPEYVAVPMLAVLGTMIGRKRWVQVKKKWREFAVTWVMVVGRSGGGKTPGHDIATAPLYARQRALAAEYKRELKDWKDLSREEQAKTPKPVMRQVVTTDATVEGLAVVLDKSPACYSADELIGFVRGMGKYTNGKSNDRQQYLTLWGSGDWVITRKTSDPIVIHDPFLTVCGGIQPDVVGDLIGGTTEDGLAARFLVSFPDPLPAADWTDDDAPDDDEYQRVCNALWAMKRADVGISLSPQAKAVWVGWFNAHQRDEPPDPLRPFWSKCKGYVLRLALVLFMARVAAGETDADELDAESMAGAVELIRYFQAHARRVYGTAAVKDGGRIANALAWVRKRGGEVNARLVRQNEVSGAKTQEAAEQLLRDLADLGHGTLTTTPGKSPVFRLGPPNAQPDNDEGGAE